MAKSNTTNTHMQSMATGGGFAPPSKAQHPPTSGGKVGGVHNAGKVHKIDGGHLKGDQAAGLHPSLRKGKG